MKDRPALIVPFRDPIHCGGSNFMLALTCALILILISVFSHYEGLRLLSAALEPDTYRSRPRRLMLVVIFSVILIHLLEIFYFAIGYWVGHALLHIGTFSGIRGMVSIGPLDYFYFSAETYTSLGIGDAYPVGNLRLIASLESLVGLLLIGWSTSFTYIAMTKYWNKHDQ